MRQDLVGLSVKRGSWKTWTDFLKAGRLLWY